ncbi:MAG: heme o synthase [Anaerolineae bacterium]
MSLAKPVRCPAAPTGPAGMQAKGALWPALLALFKVRIVALLLFAAVGGLFLAADGWPGGGRVILLLVSGGLAAAGASALNEYLERGADALMVRTRGRRPLVNGAISRPAWVPYAGALMIAAPVLGLLPFNPALSFFLLFGAAVYVGIYTSWLKPRTPLNIVIGGAAGSAAVLSGSAAAGHWQQSGALLLAMLVFLWTPTHFWSLAITYRQDYALGRFPMLPVKIGPRASAGWVLLHTAGTALAALALAAQPSLGLGYLIPVGLATVTLLFQSLRLVLAPGQAAASRLFLASNLYLALVLVAICVNVLV